MSERSVDQLIDGWEAAWSDKDGKAFAGVCSRSIQYEDPTTGEPLEGVEQIVDHAERLWTAFPDVRMEQTGDRLNNERYVAAPCKLLGTHRGSLNGLPATNRFLVVHAIFYCEIRRNRLLRVRGFFDLYDAATQLGILPGHGTMGEKALLMLRGFGLRAGRSV